MTILINKHAYTDHIDARRVIFSNEYNLEVAPDTYQG